MFTAFDNYNDNMPLSCYIDKMPFRYVKMTKYDIIKVFSYSSLKHISLAFYVNLLKSFD